MPSLTAVIEVGFFGMQPVYPRNAARRAALVCHPLGRRPRAVHRWGGSDHMAEEPS